MIPFMNLEPRSYKIPYEIYFKLRAYSDKVSIPLSTVARSLIEQFIRENDTLELGKEQIGEEFKQATEVVNLYVRLGTKTIDWLKATAAKNKVQASNIVAYLLQYGLEHYT